MVQIDQQVRQEMKEVYDRETKELKEALETEHLQKMELQRSDLESKHHQNLVVRRGNSRRTD